MQYFFDHIFFKAFYPSPNMHKHFAKHMIFALDGCLHCKINQDECTCRGIVIQSNCMHTVLSDKTPILVYLFDETCKRAECLNELYLKGADYAVLSDALCDKVCVPYLTIRVLFDNIVKYLNGAYALLSYSLNQFLFGGFSFGSKKIICGKKI